MGKDEGQKGRAVVCLYAGVRWTAVEQSWDGGYLHATHFGCDVGGDGEWEPGFGVV